MINLAYIGFTCILIGEVIIFLLLTLPTPAGFKSAFVRKFMGSNFRSKLMWVHLALCVLAGIFYLDLAQTQVNYGVEKDRLRELGNGHVGTQVRMGYLAYQIQRVERNKYITSMIIYVTIILNLYLRMLYHVYEKRGDYQGMPQPIPGTNKQKQETPSPQLKKVNSGPRNPAQKQAAPTKTK